MEAHSQALAPGPGREMTFEEKRKLSHSMGSLAGERLVTVLQIIADGPSAPVLVSRGGEWKSAQWQWPQQQEAAAATEALAWAGTIPHTLILHMHVSSLHG